MWVNSGDRGAVFIPLPTLPCGTPSPIKSNINVYKTCVDTDLVNMSTALEFRLLTALGNLCMEAPMEAGGRSSESTEVWLANLLDN